MLIHIVIASIYLNVKPEQNLIIQFFGVVLICQLFNFDFLNPNPAFTPAPRAGGPSPTTGGPGPVPAPGASTSFDELLRPAFSRTQGFRKQAKIAPEQLRKALGDASEAPAAPQNGVWSFDEPRETPLSAPSAPPGSSGSSWGTLGSVGGFILDVQAARRRAF